MGRHILKPLPSISVCVYITSFAQEQVCGSQEEQPSGQLTVKPFQRKEDDKRQKHAVKAERLLNESTYNNVFLKSLSR